MLLVGSLGGDSRESRQRLRGAANPQHDAEKHREHAEHFIVIVHVGEEVTPSVQVSELLHDPQEHIFRLGGDGVETEKFGLTTTIIILLIKMIYRDKILGEGLEATVTTLEEIREYGKNTNLLNQKLPDGEWKSALAIMKKHQIVEYPGALRDLEDDTPIYIYSTINLYCSSALINELIEAYREENAEDEAGKEDIYTNFDE